MRSLGEQLSGFDAAGDLRGEEIPEAVFTESGVVARQGNDGRGGLAAFAYHDEANSGAGRGCALRIGWPGVKPVNWFFYLACESLVKPGKTGGTRGCGMIFLCGRGDCDSDHCLFPVKKGMSVYKTMSFHLNLEVSMFCNQCEQTAKGTGCTVMGVCGKLAPVADLQDHVIWRAAAAVPHGAQGPRQGCPSRIRTTSPSARCSPPLPT